MAIASPQSAAAAHLLPARSALCASLLAAALTFFAGCSTTPVPRGSPLVLTKPAEFYRRGPAQDPGFQAEQFAALFQDQGPDFRLPKGAYVTMVQREFGYSKVRTQAGDVGYVANEFLGPAPIIARAAPAELRKPATTPPRRRSAPRVPVQEPMLDLSDIPLPLPS